MIARTSLIAACVLALVTAATAEESMQELRKRTQEQIRKNRMGQLVIQAKPGAKIQVRQKSHEFQFGTALSNRIFNGSLPKDVEAQARKAILENFNAVVPENAMKWGYVERQRGQERWDVLDNMLAFAQENDLFIRGHCIVWSVKRFLPGWLVKLDDEELRKALDKRIVDTLKRYKGSVAEFDLNNEMILWSFFQERLGKGIRPHMFKLAHEVAPKTPMYVNDFRILSGKGLDAYEKQIESLLEAKAPVGGIGIQGHPRDGIPSAQKIQTALDRLAKFNIPIKITEFAVGEKAGNDASDQLERLYRVAFAHPAVDGIYMWGFWSGAHWRSDAAPWGKDFTLRPHAELYRKLVFQEWWTDQSVQAGDDGTAEVPAFFGTYEITVDGKTRQVKLSSQDGKATVDMR